MLTAQLKIWPLRNKLWADFNEIIRIALQRDKEQLIKFLGLGNITRRANNFRDPPTYTHQQSMQQKVPFSLIRCSSSKVAFCSCVEWGWHIYNIVESESDPLTRRAVDLFEKEPLKGNSEVHLHTPTKFGEDRSKDLGGDRETNRQTKQTNAARFIVWWCDFPNHESCQYGGNELPWGRSVSVLVFHAFLYWAVL